MEGNQTAQHYNRLVIGIFEKKFLELSAQHVRGDLIDIGCGKKPYAPALRQLVNKHVGVDHEGTFHDKSNIDIFGTAYDIPLGDALFDSAICTAVLEHLEEPEQALRECFRVLKPGGKAIYSVPFIWHLHEEPRDFFRYSKFGLKHLFEKTGFNVIDIVPLSGFWVTFLQLQIYYFKRFDRGVLKTLRLFKLFAWILQKIGAILHRFDRSYKWTWMYIVVAQKPNV